MSRLWTTKKQENKAKIALRIIKACNGDCKKCEHFRMATSSRVLSIFYAMYCGIADEAGYIPYSNTIAGIRDCAIECLEFELS